MSQQWQAFHEASSTVSVDGLLDASEHDDDQDAAQTKHQQNKRQKTVLGTTPKRPGPSKPPPSQKKPSIWSTILMLVFLGLLAFGLWTMYQEHQAAQPQPAPMPEEEFSADDPDTYTGDDIATLIAEGRLFEDLPDAGEVDPEMSYHGTDGEPMSYSDFVQQYSNSNGGNGDIVYPSFTGAGVTIPSLGINSPMIATDHNGAELVLPEPPASTWYQQTAMPGADQGNSLIASHVNWGHGEYAPFSQLHKIDKGAPVFVRDFEGGEHAYVVTDIEVFHQTALPDSLFDQSGEHQLKILTCSGPTIERGGEAYFLYNLVVTAEPVDMTVDM